MENMVPAASSAAQSTRLGKIFIGLACLAALTAATGAAYQFISVVRDRRDYPMPGRLVDVGGYKMHIYCTGQGTPTVILDSGLGDSFTSWRKVQPQVAQYTRVCSYDRAGLGYSDPSPGSRTSKDIAQELYRLLQNAGVPAPVVIVAHSVAGYDVRLYASLYRNEVAGVVLVDSSHPDQERRFPAALKEMETGVDHEIEIEKFLMPFGIPRLFASRDPTGCCHNTAADRAARCNLNSVREGQAEFRSFSESASQAATTGSLGNIPLVVLSHDPEEPEPGIPADLGKAIDSAWGKMQQELARLSTQSKRTIAKNSGHYIQLDRPDVVVEAVRNVVEQIRRAQSDPSH
jgi:pimeloyl-ACP methyl ester carboxylesterase